MRPSQIKKFISLKDYFFEKLKKHSEIKINQYYNSEKNTYEQELIYDNVLSVNGIVDKDKNFYFFKSKNSLIFNLFNKDLSIKLNFNNKFSQREILIKEKIDDFFNQNFCEIF